MVFVVYILYSSKYKIHYTGFTSNLIARFKSHNEYGTKGFTRKYRPWKVIHVEFFNDKKEALKREEFLKSGQGRDYVKLLPKIN
jgi:putative endonuclease